MQRTKGSLPSRGECARMEEECEPRRNCFCGGAFPQVPAKQHTRLLEVGGPGTFPKAKMLRKRREGTFGVCASIAILRARGYWWKEEERKMGREEQEKCKQDVEISRVHTCMTHEFDRTRRFQ